MSIIHSAYKWDHIGKWSSLMEYLVALKAKYRENLLNVLLESQTVKNIQIDSEFEYIRFRTLLTIRINEAFVGGYGILGFKSYVVVYPFQNDIYLTFHGAIIKGPNGFEIPIEHKGLKDYSYQSNKDKPENVTAYDWGQREQLWRKVTNNWTSLYKDVGLTYEFVGKDDISQITDQVYYSLKKKEKENESNISKNINSNTGEMPSLS